MSEMYDFVEGGGGCSKREGGPSTEFNKREHFKEKRQSKNKMHCNLHRQDKCEVTDIKTHDAVSYQIYFLPFG